MERRLGDRDGVGGLEAATPGGTDRDGEGGLEAAVKGASPTEMGR